MKKPNANQIVAVSLAASVLLGSGCALKRDPGTNTPTANVIVLMKGDKPVKTTVTNETPEYREAVEAAKVAAARRADQVKAHDEWVANGGKVCQKIERSETKLVPNPKWTPECGQCGTPKEIRVLTGKTIVVNKCVKAPEPVVDIVVPEVPALSQKESDIHVGWAADLGATKPFVGGVYKHGATEDELASVETNPVTGDSDAAIVGGVIRDVGLGVGATLGGAGLLVGGLNPADEDTNVTATNSAVSGSSSNNNSSACIENKVVNRAQRTHGHGGPCPH